MATRDVTLLTGFLGAGKTTLLNEIIRARATTRFAIIENEVGEENIDAELIIKSEEDIVEMNNGCICCSLNENLYDILSSLWERKHNWDELIIEATGIADPANIALPFYSDRHLQDAFTLKRVICLADAEQFEDQLKETEEAIKQVTFADIILINKTENVTAEYANELQQILKTINPFAKILLSSKKDFKITQLFEHQRPYDFVANPKTSPTPRGVVSLVVPNSQPNSPLAPHVANRNLHRRHIHSSIETLMLHIPGSMNIDKLRHRMFIFLFAQSANVYRIKGIFYQGGDPEKTVLQTVGKHLSITSGAFWLQGEEKLNRIVIIGKNLKAIGFDKLFRDCLAVGTKL